MLGITCRLPVFEACVKNLALIGLISLVASPWLSGCVTTTTGTAPQYSSARVVEVHTAIAAQYVKKGDLDSAKRHAQKALDENPKSPEALTMMALVLQQEGSEINLAKAEDFYKKAVLYSNDDAQTHNNYGVFLTQQGRDREAIEQFKIAGSTLGYSGRAQSLQNLGRTAIKVGDYTLAQSAFENALEADNSSMIARIELIDLYLYQDQLIKANILYDEYVNRLRGAQQGARSLWQGVRLALKQNDTLNVKLRGQRLLSEFPGSVETQRYKQLGLN